MRDDRSPPMLVSVLDLERASAEISWTVKHSIPSASVCTLFGASGSFKSFIALDLALHVVYGLPWLGLKTARGPALYIAAEGGFGILKRIQAWHSARGMDWRACPLLIVIRPLTLRSDASAVVAAVEAAGVRPALAIVDTLAQTYSGDENDAAEISSFYRILAIMANRWRCTVIVVHHTGHSATERPRGSSAIIANSDTIFGVFRSESGTIATLECQKQKDGQQLPPVSFRLDTIKLGEDADGDPITSLRAFHIADPTALAAAVSGGPDGPKKRLLELSELDLPIREARKRFFEDSDCTETEARKKEWQRTLRWGKDTGLVSDTDKILRRVKTDLGTSKGQI